MMSPTVGDGPKAEWKDWRNGGKTPGRPVTAKPAKSGPMEKVIASF
jgi:hypothetical protein